ncbi:MAG: efflux RND transporter periplasmic adaptor subunit [Chitinophaga sp.]|uniref:efflux RND transporter periplasmic adaptor subunit n=1 Tax=Chitinophaga sp. TaxID=1869181 RepID=UPI0025BDA928|nr:efflux RND transporter periplasmic adaptor subunit [Chitinophaga sp.]MBV8253647.1 efflux RND transporter periplasmic adaptor subunit [Chitinophaga sp.]
MKRLNNILFIAVIMTSACHNKQEPTETATTEVHTPVTVTTIDTVPLTDYIELNATSSFLQNNYIKANTTGYVKDIHVLPGQYIKQGQLMFTLQTKESRVIGNTVSALDSSFRFTGINRIVASGHGYVTQLNHQPGDYVQDGELLAVISDMNSFVFILNLPYELRPYVLNQKTVKLYLPDNTTLNGTISQVMPTVDSLSQTQNIIIKVNSPTPIPQNLVAKVHITRTNISNAVTLPKAAVLSDESQTSFWVMKLIDSTTAVRVDIKKGAEIKGHIEILAPRFTNIDRFLLTGNYGLPDTAKVTIMKVQ